MQTMTMAATTFLDARLPKNTASAANTCVQHQDLSPAVCSSLCQLSALPALSSSL